MEKGESEVNVEISNEKSVIRTFQDLDVYKNLYRAMVLVHQKVAPLLPREEKYDLVSQIMRASKAAPALVAEGFAKRYQIRQWRKYLNDAKGESNEMIHHLTVCIDLYTAKIDVDPCKSVIKLYDVSCRQMTRLGQSWQDFHNNK
ncbi:MAG: four helix bundle protein [Candidatus Uhrbacteria bacterium]|nr:four helix bundle protein [Candidatus Uhrbacteria bacterium]